MTKKKFQSLNWDKYLGSAKILWDSWIDNFYSWPARLAPNSNCSLSTHPSMLRNLTLAFGAALMLLTTAATAQRKCGAQELLNQQLENDPVFRETREMIELQTREFIQKGGVQDRVQVTIPVVVHVLWNTTAQNVSDAQIQSQLDVLNDDFRKLNTDISGVPSVFSGLTADMEVNFCLATQDNNGVATTGIERRQTTNTSWAYTNNNMKLFSNGGLNAWNRDKYLNLWVCNLSGGILGFATFPGGAANVDGVVITTTGFGTIGTAAAPFNKGRTGTHEVGHWLNLYHIWGDDGTGCSGTDQVNDTPNQADEHYGCPAFPQVSCSNGPNGDMFMNYMDYTDDACMFMFSAGQKARSQALFATGGARAALLNSPGCQPPSGGSCATPSGLAASGITQTSATVSWGAVSGATSYNLQWKISTSSTWTTVSGLSGTSYGLSGLTASTTYNYQVQAVCSSGSSTYSAAASFTTLASGGCTDVYESNETRNAAKSITVGQAITAKISSSTDKDYFKFNNTSTARNVKVDLTNLPADYDLKLYRGNSLKVTSENGGTNPEQTIYNNTEAVATYTAYVYGYQGVFNNSVCYSLVASLSSSNWRADGSTDGQVEEIELAVQFENAGFGLFPNPTSKQVTVEVPMETEADVQITIFDPSGKAAVQQHRTLGKGDNQMIFDVSALPTGVYFVQVRNGEMSHTRKLVVNSKGE